MTLGTPVADSGSDGTLTSAISRFESVAKTDVGPPNVCAGLTRMPAGTCTSARSGRSRTPGRSRVAGGGCAGA